MRVGPRLREVCWQGQTEVNFYTATALSSSGEKFQAFDQLVSRSVDGRDDDCENESSRYLYSGCRPQIRFRIKKRRKLSFNGGPSILIGDLSSASKGKTEADVVAGKYL